MPTNKGQRKFTLDGHHKGTAAMRTILFIGGLFWSGLSVADTNKDDAWVILDARVIPERSKQPTLIAVASTSRQAGGEVEEHHLTAGQTLVPLAPGTYFISHISFAKTESTADNSIYMDQRKFGKFEVVAGAITFVGLIELKSTEKEEVDGVWDMRIRGTTEPLSWACGKNPETMARLPLRIKQDNGSYALRKITCDNQG